MKINEKHFEIIVRQMMRKVQINEPGDTNFLEQELVDKLDFREENDRIWGKKVVVDAVAHHCHLVPLFLQIAHQIFFVLWVSSSVRCL